jgi:arylformamidase
MLIDVSVPLRAGMPHWPGDPPFQRELVKSFAAGDASTVSRLNFGAHSGTHMDAPVHFVPGAEGIDAIPLDACVGPVFVADLTHVDGAISAADLDAAAVPDGTVRLLAKTRNSGWAGETAFREDFVAYDASAADWCLASGVRFVGIDYLSIEPFGSGKIGHPVHNALLGGGVVVLEGVDLAGVEPGEWELIALPIPVDGCDGAPARVLLRR